MVCTYCSGNTAVVNSRLQKRSNSVWRRRQCLVCGLIATSIEQYDLSSTLVVKKRSGASESFSRDKLLISIAKSTDHRQHANQAASELTTTIIYLLKKKHIPFNTISSQDISQMANLVLKRYDAASAVRYLSFQKPMRDAKDIKSALK